MGQRSASALPTRALNRTWQDFVQCEVDHDTHEVHPQVWPPPRVGSVAGVPSMVLSCVRCGTNCIVYAGHALPTGLAGHMKGITVVLPEGVAAAALPAAPKRRGRKRRATSLAEATPAA